MINENYPEPPSATRLNTSTDYTAEKNIAKNGDKQDSSKTKTKITLSDYQVNRLNNPHTIRVKFNREGVEIAVENITGSWRSNLQECITESVHVYKFVYKHYEKYYKLNLHAEDLPQRKPSSSPL